jgi:hypothetical protein
MWRHRKVQDRPTRFQNGNTPPLVASPQKPVSGEIPATAYRLTMGMGEPVNGPVAMTIGFSGDSGSTSGDSRS